MNRYQKAAKQFLSGYLILNRSIQLKYLQIERLRTRCTSGAIRYDKLNVQTSPVNVTEESLVDAADIQRELESDLTRRKIIKNQVKKYIRRLKDDDERLIMNYRYICNIRFDDIPDKACCSRRTMWYRYERALDEIGRMLEADNDKAVKEYIKQHKKE